MKLNRNDHLTSAGVGTHRVLHKFILNKIIWKVMKRKCSIRREKNKGNWRGNQDPEDNETVQDEKFLHTFEFKCENKFYANTCKVEKVIVDATKRRRWRRPFISIRLTVFYLLNWILGCCQWTKWFRFFAFIFVAFVVEGTENVLLS